MSEKVWVSEEKIMSSGIKGPLQFCALCLSFFSLHFSFLEHTNVRVPSPHVRLQILIK